MRESKLTTLQGKAEKAISTLSALLPQSLLKAQATCQEERKKCTSLHQKRREELTKTLTSLALESVFQKAITDNLAHHRIHYPEDIVSEAAKNAAQSARICLEYQRSVTETSRYDLLSSDFFRKAEQSHSAEYQNILKYLDHRLSFYYARTQAMKLINGQLVDLRTKKSSPHEALEYIVRIIDMTFT